MNAGEPVVLLVEDDAGDVELLRHVFETAGGSARFRIATDGGEAIRELVSTPELPDLVLLDLNLPVVRGIDVLAFIKSEPNLRTLPVAILTSSDAPNDREGCGRHGCVAYLVKPSDLGGFRALVKVLMRILETCRGR